MATDFIDYCPTFSTVEEGKDPVKENLAWRVRMRELAIEDRHVQQCLKQAAFDDVLFFFNAFLWVYEPRALVKIKPFVTWPHQDPVILAIDQAIDDSERLEQPIDVIIDKSRGQGATFMYTGVFDIHWLRDQRFSAGLVTRTEDLVDSLRDPDTLLWKVDFTLRMLPRWMLPEGFDFNKHRSLSEHSFFNPERKSTTIGYSATGDVGRGGRKTVFGIDELGSEEFIKGGKDYAVLDSTAHVTNCRIIPSTFGGDSGAFYEMTQEPGNAVLLVLDWKDNPTQNKLMYVVRESVMVPVDPDDGPELAKYAKENADNIKKLQRRGFIKEGEKRSPWYDRQCLRPGATQRGIARELDRNPRGAVGKVFATDVLDAMKKKCCRPPLWQGTLVYNDETLVVTGLIQQENGPLKLWFLPGVDNEPPSGRFALGNDIAAGGTGDYSSNSVACGANRETGEQVLEYAVKGVYAEKFARISVVLAKWLNNAYMAWEASGPTGVIFGKEVLEVAYYGNVYYRDVKEVGQKAKSRSPGWWNGCDADKAELFEALCIAYDDGEFIPRSEDLIRECGEYEWEHGKIVHKPSKQHGIAEKSHGDRCVGAGVTWLACRDRPVTIVDSSTEMLHNPPYGSFAWRQMRDEEENRPRTDDDPPFTLRDLLGS